jgi:hypothetical protein
MMHGHTYLKIARYILEQGILWSMQTLQLLEAEKKYV